MRKQIYISIVFFFILTNGIGQKYNIGISIGTTVYQRTEWDRSFYAAPNSYHTYTENNVGEGLVGKNSILSAFNIGTILNIEYKRFSFNIEPQYYYQRISFLFDSPYYIERSISKKGFRMPTYFTVRLFKKAKSPFIIAGLNLIKEKNYDIQSPGVEYYFEGQPLYTGQIEVGPDHFGGKLYDNRVYWNYIFGIGKKKGKWGTSIRFQSKVDLSKHEIEAKIWQVEIAFNFLFLSSKDFTNKHFLYEEE